MKERQQQGNGKAEADFMVVSRTKDGFRVYPALYPSRPHLVSGHLDDLACTCDAFAEDGTCEHVRAVLQENSDAERVEREERRAIQAEGQPTPKQKRNRVRTGAPAVMTLKRSVSPDGRIDSLSVELSCPVGQTPIAEIRSRATDMLKLQSDIARGFLRSNGADHGNQAKKSAAQAIPAKMLSIGTSNGKYGPRFFISFQANGQGLKLFGTSKQLVQAIVGAGFDYSEEDIAEGVYLNLPCRVTTKPSADGRYINIDRVFPGNQDNPPRSGKS